MNAREIIDEAIDPKRLLGQMRQSAHVDAADEVAEASRLLLKSLGVRVRIDLRYCNDNTRFIEATGLLRGRSEDNIRQRLLELPNVKWVTASTRGTLTTFAIRPV